MNQEKHIFKQAVSYNGEYCDVCHINTDSFDDVPESLKCKAHAVCVHNGKIVLVNHPEWNIWSIPGGTRDDGESIEETLIREVMEETNCQVDDSVPISYQEVVSSSSGKVYYCGLQYMCNITPLGEFMGDTGGDVDKITWIDPFDFEKYIEGKEFRRAVLLRAVEVLGR